MKYNHMIYIALVISAILTGCIKDDKEEVIEYVTVGDRVPAFTITSDSHSYNSDQKTDKATLLVFFSPVCYDCKRELPKLEFVWENLQDNSNFQQVTVVRDMTLGQLAEAENGSRWLSMPCYPDPDRTTYHLFATVTIPRVYLIDKERIIRKMWVNEVPETEEQFLAVIQSYITEH